MTAVPVRLGPNDRAPCPSPSSIRRHTILLEHCPVCGVDGPVRKKAA